MEEGYKEICKHCGSEMKSDSAYCEKCGRKQNEKKDRKKTKRWMVILIVVVLFIAGIIGTFMYLLKSGKLYEKGYLNDIYHVVGMCVEHHFSEADCINPETCEICGKIQGNPKGHAWKEADCVNPEKCEVCGMTQGVSLGHSWADATCSNPKECTVCHLTNGEPLGHITRLGKCSRCGEFQKELFDEFMLIRQYADSATQYVESANNEINEKSMSSLSNAYRACLSMCGYYESAKAEYKKAYDSCGSYVEFAEIKKLLKGLIDNCPTTTPSYSLESCVNYLEQNKVFIECWGEYLLYTRDLLSQLQKDRK